MDDAATYRINQGLDLPSDVKCVTLVTVNRTVRLCGHSLAAHGTGGYVCGGCPCLEFTPGKITPLKAVDPSL